MTTPPLLSLTDLRVSLPTPEGPVQALRGLSLRLQRGQSLGLVGASGCGKSMTALAVMGLLPEGARLTGTLQLDGTELSTLSEAQWCRLRGRRLAMVFQEPMSALNPLHPIGRQVAEPLRLHQGLSAAAARAEALRLLNRVQLPQAAQRLGAYPHQLSGGQRQRVLIARALVQDAPILLLDEPFAGVDNASTEGVESLINDLAAAGRAVLIATHDIEQACRWDSVLCLNHRQVAFGPPAILTTTVVEATYGGAIVSLPGDGGTRGILPAHHHDHG